MKTQTESDDAYYSLSDIYAKQQQLDEISKYYQLRRQYQGPRQQYFNTMLVGVMMGGLVILFSYRYFSTSLPFYLTTGAVAAVMIYMWIHMQSLDGTYANMLDKLLTAYDPVDKAAYQALQNGIRKAGFMDVSLVVDWVSYEDKAINLNLAQKSITPVMYDFLQKRV